MSALLADVGLNIREAHVFSTSDGYSLDVFVVDGWPSEVLTNSSANVNYPMFLYLFPPLADFHFYMIPATEYFSIINAGHS